MAPVQLRPLVEAHPVELEDDGGGAPVGGVFLVVGPGLRSLSAVLQVRARTRKQVASAPSSLWERSVLILTPLRKGWGS